MPTIAAYLKFANLQMAAEALFGFNATPPGTILTPGDKLANPLEMPIERFARILTDGNLHASRFAATEATKFVDPVKGWKVVEHISNTTTGFSGTLFKNNETDELVLSFRSTEFIDDAARDNEATNKLEIKDKGFAFGQLSDMEDWYQSLVNAGKITGPLSVTGYSLGSHLATAFNLMHPGVATQVINFNGAGLGTIGDGSRATMQNQLPQMIQYFADLRDQAGQVGGLEGIFTSDLGRQAYRALRTALEPTKGVPPDTADSLLAVLAQNKGGHVLDMTELYDFDLLKKAVEASVQVTAAAHRVGKLTSGSDKVPPNPAKIGDLAPDGTMAIAGESLDYQLAVFLTQKQFNTAPLSFEQGVSAALGNPTPAAGGALTNQWDVAGTETTTPPWYMVAYSQYRYGNDVKLFIEDQPFKRGNVLGETVEALLSEGRIELLHDQYVNNDFGDTHSLALIVDSLNVQNTILNLLPGDQRAAATSSLDTILKNASWRKAQWNSGQGQAEGDVLENVVNSLADLFLGPQPKAERLNGSPEGNTWWDWANSTVNDTKYSGRDAFYAKLQAITDSTAYKALTGSNPNLTLVASTDIAAGDARTDFTKFAALYSLSPFRLSGQALEGQISSAWGQAFTDWNADKTNAGSAGAPLTFSESWMADRAEFLKRKNLFNAANLNPFDPSYQHNSSGDAYRNDDSYYWDVSSDYKIAQGQVSGATRRYFFGDERGNVLDGRAANGNSVADHLYGMAGQDVLIGGGGNDRLDGGTGYDSYVWSSTSGFFGSNDGDDRLIDADRKGRVLINGSAATLFVKKTDTTWVSPDGKLTLTQPADSSSSWKLSIDGGGSLDLGTSFTDGDFGLHRQDAPAAAPTTVTIEGDKAPKAFTANFSGPINPASHGPGWYNPVITVTAEHADPDDPTKTIVDSYKVTYNTKDALGNYDTDGAASDRPDTLYGHASQADYIQSGGGADVIDARGGHDRVQAGSGDDRVTAGAGDDLVEGGAGADILFGEADADILWGDTAASGSTPIASAIANAISTTDTEASQVITGDWLDGGVGNDVLIGGAGDDLLLGDAPRKSRRLRHGDIRPKPANQNLWRNAA